MRICLIYPVFLALLSGFANTLEAQSLTIFSGNGQLVSEQFVTTVPLRAQAKDAAGHPAPGVTVSWSITQGTGTIRDTTTITDANGIASSNFLATNLPPGTSFLPATITAASPFGSANFTVTTAASRQPGGGLASPAEVDLVTPSLDNRNISGTAGSVLPGAVVVRVTALSGIQLGMPIPNIGVRIVNSSDPGLPSAMCNAPGGVVLTDAHGLATCDLVLGPQTGTISLVANAGEQQNTSAFMLQVTPGVVCAFTLSPAAQAFTATGGSGIVNVTAPNGCTWTAASNASWITIAGSASGSGNGAVSYSVAANPGAARSGTILMAGQIFNVTQSAAAGAGPTPLTITTGGNLPVGTVGSAYAATLTATGGTAPYTWTANGTLPPGFSLNGSTGILSGTSASPGNFTLSATVSDATGKSQTQAFSLVILTSSSSLAITNTGLPSGVVGVAYQQPLTSSGGCVTPFSPVPAFSLASGALPAGISLQQIADRSYGIAGTPTAAGTANFTVVAQDACGNRASATFSIAILPVVGSGSTMSVTPASLAFSTQVGSTTRPVDQALSVTSNGMPIPYNASVSTTTGGNWLALGNSSGSTPGTLTVSVVNYGQLAIGTYNGSITIASGASNSPVTVPVSLTITGLPLLMVSPVAIAFTQPAFGGTVSQQTIVVASGGAPAHFTVTATTVNGGPWLFINTGTGDTPATLLVSVSAAGLAPGTYSGAVAISIPGGVSQIVAVTLTVPASATFSVSRNALSFAFPSINGASPTQNLDVSSSAGASQFTVSTSATTGGNWLFATPRSGVTPVTVAVSVNPSGLPLGTYTGSVIITPGDSTIAPVSVPVVLTVGQTAPTIRSITNAASFAPGPVAPGEIVTLFGSAFGPLALAVSQLDSNGNLASSNAGTQVSFDGIPAPILYTSDGQVAVIVPYEIYGRDTVTLQVSFNGALSNTVSLRVVDAAPAIFTLSVDGQAAVINQDGSVNSPASGADPGSYVSIFATGEGQTDPPGVDGKFISATSLPRPRLPVSVQINGEPADVLYAGGAPGLAAGLLQVNVRVPADLPHAARVPVVLTVGTQASPAALLSVK